MRFLITKAIFLLVAITAFSRLEAQGTFSLVEVNPRHGNSALTATSDSAKTYYGAGELTGFTDMGGKLYFSAQDNPSDDELWVTDGGQVGTSLVKSINPGHGAKIGNLVLLNNRIIFMASQNGASWDLWGTDGTDTGTKIVDTLNQTNNTALGYNNFAKIGNRILFCTKEKLLITDGTNAGTDSLLAITNYSQGFGYCDLPGGGSYFILPENSGAFEIWRSDGTTTGTESVLSLDTTSFNINNVISMLAFNGKLYLAAASASHGADLFTFDGNVNGQLNRVAIAPNGNSNPHGFNEYNGDLYFIANNDTTANVYRITSADSIPHPLIPNAAFNALSNLTIANGTAYCKGPDSTKVYSIELGSFTYSTFSLPGYRLPSYSYTDAPFLVGLGQPLYFEAYDVATNNQLLLQSDFTPAGTRAVAPTDAFAAHPFNCRLSNGIHDVFDIKTWGSKLLVPANFDSAGRELWIFNPDSVSGITEIDKEQLFSIYPNPANNELTVRANPQTGAEAVRIFTITGQEVLQETLQGMVSIVDVSALPTGLYFIAMSIGGKSTGAQKLLVVK